MGRVCPLCQESYSSSRFRCELECHHELCFFCAKQWLYEHDPFQCPYCRYTSMFFYRPLRSHLPSLLFMDVCHEKTILVSRDPTESYLQVAQFLERYILQQSSTCYKPLFRPVLKYWKQRMYEILIDMHKFSRPLSVTDHVYILRIFDQVFSLLRSIRIE